jgi:hypothetical protein
MFRTILTIFVVCLVIAFFSDPTTLAPWKDALGHAGGAITKGVEKLGKVTDNELKDIENGDSVVNKVPSAVSSAVGSVANAVTQK